MYVCVYVCMYVRVSPRKKIIEQHYKPCPLDHTLNPTHLIKIIAINFGIIICMPQIHQKKKITSCYRPFGKVLQIFLKITYIPSKKKIFFPRHCLLAQCGTTLARSGEFLVCMYDLVSQASPRNFIRGSGHTLFVPRQDSGAANQDIFNSADHLGNLT